MQYATLGNTGLVVSRLAFGAMTFTSGNQDLATIFKVGAQAANELVGRALDAGVNFFDTADAYAGGQSEALLGQALKSRRNEVVIATKVGFRSGTALTQSGLSRRHILWSVDESLTAPRHRLDRRLHRAPRGPVHAARRNARCARRRRALRQGSLHRLLQLVGVESRRGARDPEGERPRAVHARPDALLAARPRRRARRDPDDASLRPRHDGLEPARFRLPERQVHARDAVRSRQSLLGIRPAAVRQGTRLPARGAPAQDRRRSTARASRRPRSLGCSRSSDVTQRADRREQAASARRQPRRCQTSRSATPSIAELDAATALSPVYPNWFIERLQDQVTAKALAR